jgi:hypothetical protein
MHAFDSECCISHVFFSLPPPLSVAIPVNLLHNSSHILPRQICNRSDRSSIKRPSSRQSQTQRQKKKKKRRENDDCCCRHRACGGYYGCTPSDCHRSSCCLWTVTHLLPLLRDCCACVCVCVCLSSCCHELCVCF